MPCWASPAGLPLAMHARSSMLPSDVNRMARDAPADGDARMAAQRRCRRRRKMKAHREVVWRHRRRCGARGGLHADLVRACGAAC